MVRRSQGWFMKRLGLHGERRGKVVHTRLPDNEASCPLDRVNRQFEADRPNQVVESDFTYVSTRRVDNAGPLLSMRMHGLSWAGGTVVEVWGKQADQLVLDLDTQNWLHCHEPYKHSCTFTFLKPDNSIIPVAFLKIMQHPHKQKFLFLNLRNIQRNEFGLYVFDFFKDYHNK